MTAGVDAAYKAVMKPAEGTILTVSRVATSSAVEFAEHGGDPGKFADEMKSAHPDLPYRLMTPGEYTEI